LVFTVPTLVALTAAAFGATFAALAVVFDFGAGFFAATFLAAGFLVDLALVVAITPPVNV
jgi:hypothetical protein